MRTTRYLALMVSLAAALGACSQDVPSVAAEDVKLGQAIAAVYLSPQVVDFGNGADTGYLMIVDSSGAAQALETGGMDTARVSWSPAGLFVSDARADILIGPQGVTRVDSPKTHAQFSSFALPGQVRHVSVYNKGHAPDGGYNSEVIVTERDRAKRYVVEGFYGSSALCGDEVYGLATDAGRHAEEPGTPGAWSRLMLARLYPLNEGAESVVGWQPPGQREPVVTSPVVPCLDGVLTFIHQDAGADPARDRRRAGPHVSTWNSESGKLTSLPLTIDGKPFPVGRYSGAEGDPLVFAQYDSESLTHDGLLQWLAPTGEVMSTDPLSGATRKSFDTGGDWAGDRAQVDFTEDAVWVLQHPDQGPDLLLEEFDRATGEKRRSIDIPDVGKRIGVSMVLRGFAVRPD